MQQSNFKGEYKKFDCLVKWTNDKWTWELMRGAWLIDREDGIKQYDGIRLYGERAYKDKVDKKIDISFKTQEEWVEFAEKILNGISVLELIKQGLNKTEPEATELPKDDSDF